MCTAHAEPRSYEVKNLTLLITTKSNRNTVIRCRLQNTRIESCNSAWQVVSLAESRDIDEVRQTETRYKITRIKSISISVSDPRTNIDTVLASVAARRRHARRSLTLCPVPTRRRATARRR